MFFEPHFTPNPNAWPPSASSKGILELLFFPDYIIGIDFNDKESWVVDEWKAYARFLEESGKSIIDRLEEQIIETKVELTIQQRLASRKKELQWFKEMMSQPETARLGRVMMKQLERAEAINPIQYTEKIKPIKPSGGILASLLPGIPTQKRGRRKNDDLETRQCARQILQIQSEYKAQGQHKKYREIWNEDILAPLKMRKRLALKGRFKTIMNTIPQVKKSR
ncbi:MAG: hypothetical protein ACXW00_07720 [Methylobacter sp.]